MKKYIYLILFVFCLRASFSQLLPSIGLNTLPPDTTKICTIPLYQGSFYASGYQKGDTVPDFKLYNLNGDSMILSNELAGGKPVLLIAGSLTCPVFRNKVPDINQVMSTYSANIKVFVIYGVEAHPTDTSPYFGTVNITQQNQSQGVLFPQPKTYGERKDLVDTMSSWISLNAPIFIDGPCNKWWSNFGPAPNNSYLIGTNGVVMNKHGWFDKAPDDIYCDLDSIFNVNSGLCMSSSQPGNFVLSVQNSTVQGNPGAILYDKAKIINTSTVQVSVYIRKLQKVLPSSWQSAFCADVCYSPNDDSIVIYVSPQDTIDFSLDFFTGSVADSGKVRVGFRNTNLQSNYYMQWFKASTYPNDVSVKEINTNPVLKVYPNPASAEINVITPEKEFTLLIYDQLGKEIYKGSETKIKTESWKNGVYYLMLRTAQGTSSKRILIEK